MGHYAMI